MFAFICRKQQAACWRGVVAGQAGEFLIEVLEAEAEAEGLRVFQKQLAGLGDLRGRLCMSDLKTFHHRGHRGHRGNHEARLGFHCSRDLCVPCG